MTNREPKQRTWMSIVMTKMRKMKLSRVEEKKSDNPIFPLEIQEMILHRIRDKPTLWRCRLVSSHWKQVSNSILERLRLNSWMEWQPLPNSIPLSPYANLWKNQEDEFYVYFSHKLGQTGNPFPSNSLTISKPKYTDRLVPKEWIFSEYLLRYGGYLTSLILHKFKFSVDDLEKLFCHLPNLKALTFSYLPTTSEGTEVSRNHEHSTIISLPNLTHVQLVFSSEELCSYLLQICGNHLKSLEVEANGAIGFFTIPPLCINRFSCLKYLKLYYTDKDGVEITKLAKEIRNKIPAPIEFLSIYVMDVGYRGFDRPVDLGCLMNFVSNFRSTLTYFYLDVRLRHLGKLDSLHLVYLLKLGELFPALKKLVIIGLQGWNEEQVEVEIRSKFPNLDSIEFSLSSR
ncbi:unnamed protein product [Orchesella dallaii]|uniref:F-box domain-containing protein n=1 Tax=Orchesella dallaii TaxID=48710 RepID=A0ABP1S7L8_9HEXA